MAIKILVPLRKHDRLDEIVPYIEEVAEPGASVVFLIRHPVSGFKWLQAYAAISHVGSRPRSPSEEWLRVIRGARVCN